MRPGSLAPAQSGTQSPACGLRGFGPRVSLASVPAARGGGGGRRGQLSPQKQRGGGGGRTPGPARRTPQLSASSGSRSGPGVDAGRGAGLSRGAAVTHDSVVFGEGPAGLS